MRSHRLVPFAALALIAADCGSDAASDTWRAVHEVYAARTAGSTASRSEWSDGWGRAFRFEVRDTSFRLLSAGADGTFGTSDDLDFSPHYLAARASTISGCWATTSMRYPDGEVRELALFDRRVDGAPDFRGETNLASTNTRWTPWGGDSVVVFLMVGPQLSLIRAKLDDGALRGSRVLFGEGPVATRVRRDFAARRTACDSVRSPE